MLAAGEAASSPIILQVLPDGSGDAIWSLITGLRVLADAASVPVAVHLDHCSDLAVLRRAIGSGVDGPARTARGWIFAANARFVADVATEAHEAGVDVEAELGRLAGSEEGWTVDAREARLTRPDAVPAFLAASGAGILAVSIGNVHGATPAPPTLDLDRLRAIRQLTDAPLVLHGGSGLDDDQLHAAIELGICKINVNTELRVAYRDGLLEADGCPGVGGCVVQGPSRRRRRHGPDHRAIRQFRTRRPCRSDRGGRSMTAADPLTGERLLTGRIAAPARPDPRGTGHL